MKYVFIILATIGILLQSFSKVIIFINFEMNREYIAANLCVQRDKKENCCKGNCHLKRSLEEDEKRQSSPASDTKDLKEVQIYCQSYSAFDFEREVLSIAKFSQSPDPSLIAVSFSIFHPPQGLV